MIYNLTLYAAIFVVMVLVLLIIIKIYIKMTMTWNRSYTCLVGKTAIVTGANTGIGYWTAQDFAKRGARVILGCRNKQKGEAARDAIIDATGNKNVIVKTINMSSLQSVRDFAAHIHATEDRLDILVNNAGAGGLRNHITNDGLHLLMQTNHFGPFLLTNLLIDLLKKSAPSRIVIVSSYMANMGKLTSTNLKHYMNGAPKDLVNYSNSKLLNIIFSNELARRLEGSGVTVNSLHPGTVMTDIFRRFQGFFKVAFFVVAKTFFKTPEEGAQTSIYLSVSKTVEQVSGEYFENCEISRMPTAAKNIELCKKVWEVSQQFVNLRSEEYQL